MRMEYDYNDYRVTIERSQWQFGSGLRTQSDPEVWEVSLYRLNTHGMGSVIEFIEGYSSVNFAKCLKKFGKMSKRCEKWQKAEEKKANKG
jgi:hypothetical protein